jgi:hypothetical protein
MTPPPNIVLGRGRKMHSPRLREYVRTTDARGMNGAGTQCAGRGALLWEIDPGRRVEGGCPAKNPPLAVYRPACEGSKNEKAPATMVASTGAFVCEGRREAIPIPNRPC